jgi:hypothetical protein
MEDGGWRVVDGGWRMADSSAICYFCASAQGCRPNAHEALKRASSALKPRLEQAASIAFWQWRRGRVCGGRWVGEGRASCAWSRAG